MEPHTKAFIKDLSAIIKKHGVSEGYLTDGYLIHAMGLVFLTQRVCEDIVVSAEPIQEFEARIDREQTDD